MDFKIKVDKKRGVYIPKAIFFIAILAVFLVLIILFLLTRSQKTNQPKNRLGVAPFETLPQDSDKASDLMIKKIQEDYKNKLVLIFFFDGYSEQKEAVSDVKILTSIFDSTEPYKSLKDMISYKIITSDNRVCHLEDYQSGKSLVCDNHTFEGIQRLGIDHIKIVAISPQDFTPVALFSRGKDSVFSISTYKKGLSVSEFEKKIKQDFLKGLAKSLGVEDSVDGFSYTSKDQKYLSAVLACFYGGKEAYLSADTGKYFSCKEFTDTYPNFWDE